MKFDFIKIYCKLLEDKREYLITIEFDNIKYFIEFKTGYVDSKLIIGSFYDPSTACSTFFYKSESNRGVRDRKDIEYYTVNRNISSMDNLLRVFMIIIYQLSSEVRQSNIIKRELINDLSYSGFQVDNKRYKLEDHWDENTLSFVYSIIEITDKKNK